MKIASWNVNGLAACKRKGFLRVLANSRADIFCCQEIKAHCPLSTPGYSQFWNPAQRPGYSGTLTLARKEPLSVRYGMGIREFDEEGRLIALEYDGYYVMNVYVPNSQSGLARLDYRTAWDAALRVFCAEFGQAGDLVRRLQCGPRFHRRVSGPRSKMTLIRRAFNPRNGEGMERLLALGLIDVFRTLHPQAEGAYTWWSMRLHKRLEKSGVAAGLLPAVRSTDAHASRHHPSHGHSASDHRPISLTR